MKAHKYLKKYLPKLTDYLLGTDADTSNKTTRNFQLNDIKSLVLEGLGVDGGGKLRVTEIEIATLVTDISTTVNAMTEYIVNKSEIVFFNVAGSVYVLKQSDVTIGLGAEPLTNDDFLLLASESGISTLLEATDFPNTYIGQALKSVRVKNDETGVEFFLEDKTEAIIVPISDLVTNLSTGITKAFFTLPYNFTLSAVKANLLVAQTAGTAITFDIYKNGTSILSTKITIDNSETTSLTASTPPVISTTSLEVDSRITIGVTIGTAGAKGGVVTLIGKKV